MRDSRSYNPREYYDNNPNIRRVLDSFQSNMFCRMSRDCSPGYWTVSWETTSISIWSIWPLTRRRKR